MWLNNTGTRVVHRLGTRTRVSWIRLPSSDLRGAWLIDTASPPTLAFQRVLLDSYGHVTASGSLCGAGGQAGYMKSAVTLGVWPVAVA